MAISIQLKIRQDGIILRFIGGGAEATLEEVARRAGVGIGTLYRNFSTREDLVEAIYLAEVQAVCDYAEELDREDAFAALVAWLRRLVQMADTKRVLVEGLAFNLGAFPAARDALYATGSSLISDAQRATRAPPGRAGPVGRRRSPTPPSAPG